LVELDNSSNLFDERVQIELENEHVHLVVRGYRDRLLVDSDDIVVASFRVQEVHERSRNKKRLIEIEKRARFLEFNLI
jgi:hypothetical protein